MELTNEDIRMVLAERRRREAEERRFKARQEKEYPCLVYERGSLRAYKDCDDYIDNLKTKEGGNEK